MSLLPTLSIVCRLIICVCCGALNDHYGVPRNTILHPNDLKVFREDNIYNYTTMLLRDDLGVVLLGAREAIFALDINNISTRKSGVYWPVTEEKQRECTYKGKQAEVECRNYIRTLHIINDTTVYVCGTYAFSPICDYLTFANGQLLLKGKQEEGKGKCPFDPFQRYSSLMVGNDLYSATSINFLGSEPVILRSSGLVALRSDFKKIWLNEPNFVFMDIVGESVDSPDGDDDKVYLFFSENAVEYDFYTKVKVSRVARVCKGDMGGQRTLQRKWTSFLKARLDCSLPEPSLPLIVQDVFLMKHNDWRKGVFYGIFTPQSGLSQVSAVCAYSISDIRNIFNGGKFKTRVAVESSQDKYVMYSGEVPVPRPGACINDVARKMGVNESRQLPDKTLQFVRDRPLMDDAVSPVTGRPLLLKSGPLLTRIVVDSVTALNQQKYHVMFIGTENGFIQKAVNYAGEMFIIEEIQVVDSPEPIGILRLSSSKGHLYAGSDSSVIQMPVSNCRRYKNCVDCVLSRDPYCAWDTSSEQCSSVRSLSTSSKNTVQSLEEGDVSECPAPGMDCKSNNNGNKKLIQARLPFKRLNTEPKENQPPKRPRAPACPQPVDSDKHNENVSTPLSERSGPPLVNGRGPIDGFFSRRHLPPSDEKVIIDLTAESSPIKGFTPPAAACHPAKSKLCAKDKPASSEQPLNVEDTSKPRSSDSVTISDDEGEQSEAEDPPASTSQLDTTQDSNSEPEEQNESGNVSSSENRSTQSASPGSPLSESSPENKEAGDATPTRTPKEMQSTPTLPSGQKNAKRRSLKSLQEQEERLRLRQEKERQKEEAKAEKEKKKEEARKLKEKREKEKRERKEKDEREKREKKEKDEKEKAERVKAKEELRKSKIEAKLEEKRKKEEEKRMKEEEKRLKEEKDRVKAEKAEITRFLQKSKTQQVPKTLAAACGKFAPFEIKENMALAPLTRVQCIDSVLEDLDHYLLNPAEKGNALEDWIGKKPRQSGATKVRQTDSPSDCIVAEGPKPDGVPDRKRYGPMKLLQFHENYRPAYWGTWSKKSSNISPRCPFKQDKDLLDYEVDSDEEWEEEEPGESLSHSEGEDEEEGGEDDDDDDGFFVPHGYLSEDEGALEEEESGDLEKQKLRQKLKAREWDELMSCKKKMKVLEPVVRGCVWEGEGDGLEILQCYAVCVFEPLPKADTSPSPEELSQRVQREDHLLGQLLPLLHGNVNSCKVIITEFQEFCRQSSSAASASPPDSVTPRSQTDNIPTRIQLRRLVKNNAVYEKRSNYRRCCWYVHAEVLSRYGQEALPVPCHWTYLTTGAREEPREEHSSPANPQGNPPSTPSMPSSSSKRKSTGSQSITQFMKRRSEPRQTEAAETDGFQADTEDDEDDCIIVSTHNGPNQDSPPSESDSPMEVAPSNSSALPESST